jgi:hypothetical protein
MKRDGNDKQAEKLVGWLANFAEQLGDKIAKDNNIDPQELKNAGYMDNILDIVNRKKKVSVEEKVAKYRELVGLDFVDNIEKEGGKEVTASRITLSIRDKVAQGVGGEQQLLDRVKQFIEQVIRNRNGSIATPAILDQLENYIKVDKEWLREHLEEIEAMVARTRKQFHPETYNELPVNDLARTDDPSRGEKEAPPFLPPATSPVT